MQDRDADLKPFSEGWIGHRREAIGRDQVASPIGRRRWQAIDLPARVIDRDQLAVGAQRPLEWRGMQTRGGLHPWAAAMLDDPPPRSVSAIESMPRLCDGVEAIPPAKVRCLPAEGAGGMSARSAGGNKGPRDVREPIAIPAKR